MVQVDYSVDLSSAESAGVMLSQLGNLGYDAVFANIIISSKISVQELHSRMTAFEKHLSELRPKTGKRHSNEDLSSSSNMVKKLLGKQKPNIFSKCTLCLANNDKLDSPDLAAVLARIRNDNKIDCFVIRPANETQLVELVSNAKIFGFDLISVEFSGIFFRQIGLVTKTLKSANRDCFIEVEVSQVFRGPTADTTSTIVSQCRSVLSRLTHGMVVSSGARSPLELRSPVDLANWGEGVLGFKHVKQNGDKLLEHLLKKKMIRLNFS